MGKGALLQEIELAKGIIEKGGGVAFTGAGISVESGIPPFRGPTGIWSKYDPKILELDYFLKNPEECWNYIRELFYSHFEKVKPNRAHFCVAELEKRGKIVGVITQNIDNLHHLAGSKNVVEFHGTANRLLCLQCGAYYLRDEVDLNQKPYPKCPRCWGLLKPDFVFFGEPIPEEAFYRAVGWVKRANFILVIGTSGEIYPAGNLPIIGKERGAVIIEINLQKSRYTDTITDIFIQAPATEGCRLLEG